MDKNGKIVKKLTLKNVNRCFELISRKMVWTIFTVLFFLNFFVFDHRIPYNLYDFNECSLDNSF